MMSTHFWKDDDLVDMFSSLGYPALERNSCFINKNSLKVISLSSLQLFNPTIVILEAITILQPNNGPISGEGRDVVGGTVYNDIITPLSHTLRPYYALINQGCNTTMPPLHNGPISGEYIFFKI